MKICFILEHYAPHIGGAETLFLGLTSQLAKAGHDVIVLTSSSGGISGVQREGNLTIYRSKWPQIFDHPIPNLRKYNDLISECDIIHTATYSSALPSLLFAKIHKKPCVLTVYESLNRKWFWVERNLVKAIVFYIFESLILIFSFDFYHAISHATEKDLLERGIDRRKVKVIYCGVDDVPFSPLLAKASKQTILYFGRPGITKGVQLLVEAVNKVLEDIPQSLNFTLVLAREPKSERASIISLIRNLNLENRFTILEHLKKTELQTLIKQSRFVVVPSITEGFGLSAIEACQLGTPVVVSDAGSLPEVVYGKVLFFRNRDVDDLSKKLLIALDGNFYKIPKKYFIWSDTVKILQREYSLLKERSAG